MNKKYEKNDFDKVPKNLARYRFKNNFYAFIPKRIKTIM